MTMWAFYAIIASVLWGLDYTLTERVLEKIELPTLLTIELFFGFLSMLGLALLSGSYKTDIVTLVGSKQTLLFVVAIALIFTIANALIVLSIGGRNATLSGLIEISYPLFIACFSWFIFRENSLNTGAVAGGILILTGVSLVFFCNR